MYLNIGEQRISLTVPFARQDFVRNVEKQADGLFREWRKAFPKKTDREIFAMVAYQFASYYEELKENYGEATRIAGHCLEMIDEDIASRARDAVEADDFDVILPD